MGDLADYMTLLEAAGELGLSKSRVEQYVRDGRLTATTFAGRKLVLRRQVAEVKKQPKLRGRPKKGEPPPEPAPRRKGGAR